MSDDRCGYSELPPGQCDHCRSARRPLVPVRFNGECAVCCSLIREGEDIRADGEGGWAHAACKGDDR